MVVKKEEKAPDSIMRFKVTLEFDGKTYDIRTMNISNHGVQIARRNPPSIGSYVKLSITMRDETSVFEGIVKRHSKCLLNGIRTTFMGIEIISPDYTDFVKDKILIAESGFAYTHEYAN